jgi:hypothetical protein
MRILSGRNPRFDFLPKLIRDCVTIPGHGSPSL